MKKYIKYSTEEFLDDEYFIDWVLNPDEQSNIFWEDFAKLYPEKKVILADARKFIIDLARIFEKEKSSPFSETGIMTLFSEVRKALRKKNKS